MKLFSAIILTIAFACLTACNTDRISPLDHKGMDNCQYLGTVASNKCGFFVQLDLGTSLHPKDGIPESLQIEGKRVALGYAPIFAASANAQSGRLDCGLGSPPTDNTNAEPEKNVCGMIMAHVVCIQASDK